MQIYNNKENSSQRRASSCSYCANTEHNASNCPRVAEDYLYLGQKPPVIPVGISETLNTRGWYSQSKYWGEWHDKCVHLYEKQAMLKQKASSSPTRSARSAPKCGFCGSKSHNRRHCSTMTEYVDRAHKANQNWRRAFYEKFVNELGISEGALLTLGKNQGYNEEPKEVMGIVTSVNWNELSLFCSTITAKKSYYRDQDYVQSLIVECQVGDEKNSVNFERRNGSRRGELAITTSDKIIVKYSAGSYSWKTLEFISVLSPSTTPLGEDWIEEGHRKSLEFLVKKRSMEKLTKAGVTALIDNWV